MSLATWPSDILPSEILRDNFSYERLPAVERTDMDSGSARARLINRNPLAKVTVSWLMSGDQVDYFNTWIESDAAYGGAWFNIDLYLSSARRTVIARFVDEPKRTPLGTSWVVTATLEVRDPNVISGDVLGVIRLLGSTGAQDMAEELETVDMQPLYDEWNVMDDFSDAP
jgi:hypothetical protein